MDAHATPAEREHTHPSVGVYVRIGIVLFVLTALEVGPAGQAIEPFFVPLLLLLSAAKFALVAMFYMHLKQDSRLFSGVFVFPLIIATVLILGLIVLEAYHFAFARAG
jgi:cytochrome c oxidase subunit IV